MCVCVCVRLSAFVCVGRSVCLQYIIYTKIPGRRSLVVTFAAISLRDPRFKPRPNQKFETKCLLPAHPMLRSGTITSPVPSLETHHEQVKGRSNGCKYVSRKGETRMKSNGR